MRKIRLVSTFMMSESGKQTFGIQIFPNTSRIKGNQTRKFGQLIEYRRTFFLKDHVQNVVEKLFPDPFLKIKI